MMAPEPPEHPEGQDTDAPDLVLLVRVLDRLLEAMGDRLRLEAMGRTPPPPDDLLEWTRVVREALTRFRDHLAQLERP